ncbi:unnamed protein product [Calypogeia fissa]
MLNSCCSPTWVTVKPIVLPEICPVVVDWNDWSYNIQEGSSKQSKSADCSGQLSKLNKPKQLPARIEDHLLVQIFCYI